jgi:hypothetical protein
MPAARSGNGVKCAVHGRAYLSYVGGAHIVRGCMCVLPRDADIKDDVCATGDLKRRWHRVYFLSEGERRVV